LKLRVRLRDFGFQTQTSPGAKTLYPNFCRHFAKAVHQHYDKAIFIFALFFAAAKSFAQSDQIVLKELALDKTDSPSRNGRP